MSYVRQNIQRTGHLLEQLQQIGDLDSGVCQIWTLEQMKIACMLPYCKEMINVKLLAAMKHKGTPDQTIWLFPIVYIYEHFTVCVQP